MLVMIILLVVTTFVVFFLAFNQPGDKTEIKNRIRAAVATGPRTVTPEKQQTRKRETRLKKGSSPLVELLGQRLGDKLKSLLPAGIYDRYTTRLTMAGMSMKVSELWVMKIVLSAVFFIVALFLIVLRGGDFNGKAVAIVGGAFLAGFMLPDMQIKQSIQKRHDEIEKNLPFTLDLLKICVEAGLDLNSAFARVVNKTKGALAEEIGRMLYEIRMGKQRAQALSDMAKRTGQPDLTSFITIVVQGERMGMSMGKILALQSEQIRIKRSQRVREKAAKIPVKMMIPMVLFILPAMFLILLGPAVIMIMQTF